MANATTKIGHGLAKALGIKVDYRDETGSGANAKVSSSAGGCTFSGAKTAPAWIKPPQAPQVAVDEVRSRSQQSPAASLPGSGTGAAKFRDNLDGGLPRTSTVPN